MPRAVAPHNTLLSLVVVAGRRWAGSWSPHEKITTGTCAPIALGRAISAVCGTCQHVPSNNINRVRAPAMESQERHRMDQQPLALFSPPPSTGCCIRRSSPTATVRKRRAPTTITTRHTVLAAYKITGQANSRHLTRPHTPPDSLSPHHAPRERHHSTCSTGGCCR